MLLFVDTETTGLPSRRGAPARDTQAWPRVVQIAWILADERGRTREAADFIVKPQGYVIPESASAIHGITTAQARAEGVVLSVVLRKFEGAVRKCTTLVAHNADFDLNVITAELFRARVRTHIERKPSICTMRLATGFCRLPGGPYGQYKWPSLAELHRKLFRRSPRSSHNALWDVRACKRSYFELKKRGLLEDASSQETSEPGEIIARILARAPESPWFDTAFIEDLRRQLEERGYVSPAQYQALVRIRDALS
jgi:DNA polymerase III epsilon subunit-like protein